MRRHCFEILAAGLTGGSLLFFHECLALLARRDYVAAIIPVFVGFAVIRVGAEMARLALVRRE